jgi:hypothetical protein
MDSEIEVIAPVTSIMVTWRMVKRTLIEIPNKARIPFAVADRAIPSGVEKKRTSMITVPAPSRWRPSRSRLIEEDEPNADNEDVHDGQEERCDEVHGYRLCGGVLVEVDTVDSQ